MNQESTWVTFLSAAATAAVVSSIFSLVSLQLQHRWEDQRRWQDRKRHVYATFLHLAGLLFTSTDHSINQSKLIELRLNEPDTDDDDRGLDDIRELLDKEDQEIWSLSSKLGIELEELSLLAPKDVRDAANRVKQLLAELADLVMADAPAAERHETLVARSGEFDSALEAFRKRARRELEP